MIKKYLFILSILFLLFMSGISVDAKLIGLSFFTEKYNPETDVCKLYSTNKGTELKDDFKLDTVLANIFYDEGLIKCKDYRTKNPCELGNQSWKYESHLYANSNPNIPFNNANCYPSPNDDIKITACVICIEKSLLELKTEFCRDLL